MHVLNDTAIELRTILPTGIVDIFIVINSNNNNTLVDKLNFEFR